MPAAKKGDWVEIEQLVLSPEDRAPTLPEDTKKTPLILRVSGFLTEDAEAGSPATIRTMIGRELAGRLRIINPGYSHSFGDTVPELLVIGTEADL